jgi:hypothetical protein
VSRTKIAVGVILTLILLSFPEYSRLWGGDIPKQNSGEGLVHRTYKVGITFFDNDPQITSQNDNHTFDVKKQLVRRGIRFAPGTSATYTPSTRKLVFVNDPDQIALFEELVDSDR